MKPDDRLYNYRATALVSAYDGDTCRLALDCGFHMSTVILCRLEGINTPEIGTPGATEARDYLTSRLERAFRDGTLVYVKTWKTEKWGRWLVKIFIGKECLNDTMIERGLGVPYDGGRR